MGKYYAEFSGQYEKKILSRGVWVNTKKDCNRLLMRDLQKTLRDSKGNLRKDIKSIVFKINGVDYSFYVPSVGDRIDLPLTLESTRKIVEKSHLFGLFKTTKLVTLPAFHRVELEITFNRIV